MSIHVNRLRFMKSFWWIFWRTFLWKFRMNIYSAPSCLKTLLDNCKRIENLNYCIVTIPMEKALSRSAVRRALQISVARHYSWVSHSWLCLASGDKSGLEPGNRTDCTPGDKSGLAPGNSADLATGNITGYLNSC